MYRSAIIGCGRIGADCGAKGTGSSMIKSHAEVYKNCELTELVAVCDSNADRVDHCKSKWGVEKGYKEVNELLENESLDLISICTSSKTHIPVLNEILKKKSVKGILVEKPVGVNLEEIQKTIEIAKSSPTSIQVNHIRRFPPVYRQIAKDIHKGKLGKIQQVSAFYTKGIVNNGTHVFDLLRLFFGEPSQISLLSAIHDEQIDPTVHGKVKFFQGFEAFVFGLSKESFTIFEIDIVGTKGRLILGDQGHNLMRFSIEQGAMQKYGFQKLQPIPQIQNTDLTYAIKYAIENLIESIELKCSPFCTLKDGYAALALSLELAYQAQNI